MVLTRKGVICKRNNGFWALINDQERNLIDIWKEKRLKNSSTHQWDEFWSLSFTCCTVKSFFQTFNIMVTIHILISTLAVYIFQTYKVMYELNICLFVPPIVYPLAFSINSDYQRREKVLEDLAAFKSSGICWYFCMREWKVPSGLDNAWINSVRNKVKDLLFLLKEYLVTSDQKRRGVILRAIYTDIGEANELNERLRKSRLPANTAIVSRAIQFVHEMHLSIERLRVVRDYRSPRSIRSFNKVVIIILLVVFAPYFVYIGQKNESSWQSYYFAVILAYIFSTLQGVQDKLDDPFDGVGEDDINVDTIDECAPVLETSRQSFYRDTKSDQTSGIVSQSDIFSRRTTSFCQQNNYRKSSKQNITSSINVAQSANEVHVYSNVAVFPSTKKPLAKAMSLPEASPANEDENGNNLLSTDAEREYFLNVDEFLV